MASCPVYPLVTVYPPPPPHPPSLILPVHAPQDDLDLDLDLGQEGLVRSPARSLSMSAMPVAFVSGKVW